MAIEVRQLIVDDVFAVARMLSKVTKGARAELALALSDKKKGLKAKPAELGMALFQSLFTESEEDLKAWLASLVGKTKEEFTAMPATTLIDIVDALMAQEGIMDFFERVSQLVTKMESGL